MKKKSKVFGFLSKELDLDVELVYKELETIGKVPANKLRDWDTIMDALNSCQENAYKARRLYLKARRVYEVAMIDIRRREHALEKEALAKLRAWLDTYQIRKQITNDMVVKQLCADEDTRLRHKKLVREREELKAMRDGCEALANLWADRKFALNAQARLIGARFEVKLGDGIQARKRRRVRSGKDETEE